MAARSDIDEIRLHHSSRYTLRVQHFTDQDAALQNLPRQKADTHVSALQVEKARDEREAAESACVAAAVAEADGNIEKAAQKLADMRRNMQHDCGTVHFPKEGRHVHAHPEP